MRQTEHAPRGHNIQSAIVICRNDLRSICRIAVTGCLCDQTYYKKIVSRTVLRGVLRTILHESVATYE